MTTPPFTPLSSQAVTNMLPENSAACLVVFDVDLTLTNGVGQAFADSLEERPGAVETIQTLVGIGHEVHLWTAGGEKHARFVAEVLGITSLLSGMHSKVEFPPQAEDVVSLLGRLPDLTVDDDKGEAVPGVPQLVVDPFWGDL